MKYKIEKRFLDTNPFSRRGLLRNKTTHIALHWVANPGTTIYGTRNYFNNLQYQDITDKKKDRYASTQFAVGPNGILQMMPIEEKAYHVGAYEYTDWALLEFHGKNPNNYCIGIEMQHPDWGGKPEDCTLKYVTDLVSELCIKYNLNPLTSVVRHFDITGKDCPKWFVAHEDKWVEYKKDISREVDIKKYKRQSGQPFCTSFTE